MAFVILAHSLLLYLKSRVIDGSEQPCPRSRYTRLQHSVFAHISGRVRAAQQATQDLTKLEQLNRLHEITIHPTRTIPVFSTSNCISCDRHDGNVLMCNVGGC